MGYHDIYTSIKIENHFVSIQILVKVFLSNLFKRNTINYLVPQYAKKNDAKSVVIYAKPTLHLWIIEQRKSKEKIVENYQASKTFVFSYGQFCLFYDLHKKNQTSNKKKNIYFGCLIICYNCFFTFLVVQ